MSHRQRVSPADFAKFVFISLAGGLTTTLFLLAIAGAFDK
jgi:hypothetical protein